MSAKFRVLLNSKKWLTYSPYCIGSGLVLYEKEKWESMSFRDLYKYLRENFHLTSHEFSNKSELINFLDTFETCVHKEKQQVMIQESVAAERKWINNYIQYGQTINDSETFIKQCRNITQTQNNLKQQYALNESNELNDSNNQAINIDNAYWKMYELLSIPNASMSCAQNIIFVLFHTLCDIINDISNDQKYSHIIENSLLEMDWKNKNKKLNILDIGCGVGLIGHSMAHFYPSFNTLTNKFGNNFTETFNLFGFDHSVNALSYGETKYKKYFKHYNEICLGDINDNKFMEKYIKNKTSNGMYDIIIASDILYQAPINGMVGVETIKKCFDLLNPGGFLIVGSPIQNSTPCLCDAYNFVLKPYFEQNNIRCILYDEIVKAEIDIGLDETYILIKMYYKAPATNDNNKTDE